MATTSTTRGRNAANQRWHREVSRSLNAREQAQLEAMAANRPQFAASVFDLAAWQAERRQQRR